MSETQLIHEFTKNTREKVRVEFMTYRGSDVLNLWVYYNDDPSQDDWKPSKKGLSISTELIPELKVAVEKAYQTQENENRLDHQEE